MIMDSLMITNTISAIFPITHCDQSHHKTHRHRKLAKAQMQYLIQILELKIPEVQPEVHLEIDQSVIDHPHREWFQEVHQEPVGEENNAGNVMRNRMLNALHLANMSRAHQVMKERVFIGLLNSNAPTLVHFRKTFRGKSRRPSNCTNVHEIKLSNHKNSKKIAVLLKLERPRTTWMKLQLVAKTLELVNVFEDQTLSTISKPGLGKLF